MRSYISFLLIFGYMQLAHSEQLLTVDQIKATNFQPKWAIVIYSYYRNEPNASEANPYNVGMIANGLDKFSTQEECASIANQMNNKKINDKTENMWFFCVPLDYFVSNSLAETTSNASFEYLHSQIRIHQRHIFQNYPK